MNLERQLETILDKAWCGIPLDRRDCGYLLSLDERSFDAGILRAAAASLVRTKNDNSAIILGQIGIDASYCAGGCKFCNFGEGRGDLEPSYLSEDQLEEKIAGFCREGDLYGLYLMTMHNYDLKRYLNYIGIARKSVPEQTQLWANVGDTDRDAFIEMKNAGVTGVYHVCRLGEGTDTRLKPEDRIKTMQNALDAGLELYTCCEPIGPEHTVNQLVDNIFIGIEMGITQHAAMRRIAVPGSPLAHHGQISELRLAQIVSVIALCSLSVPSMAYMGVHEPNALSYASGANIVTAESGANPRDSHSDTSNNRGMDMARCRKMLFEAGFDYIRRGDERKIKLDLNYLIQTDSLK